MASSNIMFVGGIFPVVAINPSSVRKNPSPTKRELMIYDLVKENISIRLAMMMYLNVSSMKTPKIMNCGNKNKPAKELVA